MTFSTFQFFTAGTWWKVYYCNSRYWENAIYYVERFNSILQTLGEQPLCMQPWEENRAASVLKETLDQGERHTNMPG